MVLRTKCFLRYELCFIFSEQTSDGCLFHPVKLLVYESLTAGHTNSTKASIHMSQLTLGATWKCCHGNITSCQTQNLRVTAFMHQTLNYDQL